MPVPNQRHPAETAARLTEWVRARRPGSSVEVSDVGGPTNTGYSHETILFTARIDGATERLVARVAPTAHSVFLEPDHAREFRVVAQLARANAVPLPRVHGYEEDPSFLGAPFWVMEQVDGRIPSDNPPYTFGGWILDLAPDEQEALWWAGLEATAAVHRVDPAPFDFLGGGLEEQLDYYERYLAWGSEGDPPAIALEALAWLKERRPPAEVHALCWGDSRLANQIFADGRCVAVLDWEMATLGDPVMDLGWWLYFDRQFSEGLGMPRPSGFPSRAETIARWESLTRRSATHVDYYELFAGFRFAVIMCRLGHLMIAFDQLPPDSDFATNNLATDLVARMLSPAEAS